MDIFEHSMTLLYFLCAWTTHSMDRWRV